VSDSRLQALERAWEASGSVEDEAAFLRERVRVGDLSQERLELAACCGHAGARHVSGCAEASGDFLPRLYAQSFECSARTNLSIAHALLADFPELKSSPELQEWLDVMRKVVDGACGVDALTAAFDQVANTMSLETTDEIDLFQFICAAGDVFGSWGGKPSWSFVPDLVLVAADDAQGCEWARIQEALRPIGTWLLESTME